jgi:hypothetical protein
VSSISIDNAGASGDTVLLGGQAGVRYRIHGFFFQCGGTTNVQFKSGSTALCGALPNVANSVVSSAYDPNGQMICNPGDDLIINSSATVQVSGSLDYSAVGLPAGGGGGAIGVNRLDFSLAKNSQYLFSLIP